VRRLLTFVLFSIFVVGGIAVTSQRGWAAARQASNGQMGKLLLHGDMSVFFGPGNPENCALRSRYKRGEPVGFRMSVIDPQTGADIGPDGGEVVVHLNYAGATQDIKMRWRATERQPERTFWVAKWVVPSDAPTGIVRYTVSAKDKHGRMGVFKPYDVDASQLTIVE